MRYVGERVIVVGRGTSYRGMRGRVDEVEPRLMVLLDGETRAMHFGEFEVVAEQSERCIGGAE